MAAIIDPSAARSAQRPSTLRAFVADERGLSTTEYVIILALIALGAFAAWKGFGASVRAKVGAGTGHVAALEGSEGAGSFEGAGGSGGVGGAGASGGSSAGGGAVAEGAGGAGGASGSSASGAGGGSGDESRGSSAAGSAGNSGAASASGGGANGANGANSANGGQAGATQAHSNVAAGGGATDVDRAMATLDQREAEALRTRRMIAFGVAIVCLLSLIGIAIYNQYRAKKIREEAQRNRDAAARQAAYALQGVDGMSSASMTPPPPTMGSGGAGEPRESLADITIPPPPRD
jgi:Flp pilus assembly pilin Flp